MLHNFLSDKFSSKVFTATPSSEDFEITNLISDDVHRKNKGFLAYPCMKPPVDIEFEFEFLINIRYIIIWPSVGTQKSSGFEIITTSNNKYQMSTNGYLKTEHKGIVFYNRTNCKIEDIKVSKEFFFVPFKSIQLRSLASSKKIKLRILRTFSSVPCLGKIEIWGEISHVHSSQRKILQQSLNIDKKNEDTPIKEPIKDIPLNITDKQEFEIPEDFLDALTYEIMCLPVTLPSGNNIDSSTLEKHKETQNVWGRKPFDPFTGQVFTDTCKPVFNSALKSRIDNFLTVHKDKSEFNSLPRTIGTNKQFYSSNIGKSEDRLYRKRNISTYIDEESDHADNLNSVLQSTLSKLTRYTVLEPVFNKIQCSECNLTDNLYKLNCSHFLCKSCLENCLKSRAKCAQCNLIILRSEVQKHYG